MRKTVVTACILMIAAWFWTAAAPGQDPPGDDQGLRLEDQEPIRVAVDAVNLYVTVNRKEDGSFVDGLTRGDFVVYEDGIPQEISNFAPETDQPLTIGMAVDTSSSVRIKLDFEKEVASDFVLSVMRPGDRALLVEFDTGVTLLQDYTNNPNDLAREIEGLRAGGGTSLYDAITLVAEQKMLDLEGRKTIVVLSDGADQTSISTFDQALRICYEAEATIFAISTTRLGADIDHEGDNALKQLTESTGGKVYFPLSTTEMALAFREINEALRNQYSITYTPKNRERDGTFRRIQVKIPGLDGAVIRHRNGYFADPRTP
ncbi:MAG TPA: VWA domain-containing protein [Acidobacteriota bacterium]|nr:VWA domain-containing protein [Acidobacteriota bacterium]